MTQSKLKQAMAADYAGNAFWYSTIKKKKRQPEWLELYELGRLEDRKSLFRIGMAMIAVVGG